MKAYEVATLVGVGKLVPNIPDNVPEVLRVVILGILHQIVFFYNNTKVVPNSILMKELSWNKFVQYSNGKS